ncbi:hypothetical protein GCM10020331_001810 [Ectobacillus funiculus]
MFFYSVQTSIDVTYGLNYISSINIGLLPFIGHTVKICTRYDTTLWVLILKMIEKYYSCKEKLADRRALPLGEGRGVVALTPYS